MSIEYAIIIKNKTRLESLIERFNTKAQAKFYIERSGGDFADYELEHDIFYSSLGRLQAQLSKIIKYKMVDKAYLPSYIFSDNQVIIAIGRDGLVANTAKYANGTPIIAVNPDHERYDGVLLPFDSNNFVLGLEAVLNNSCHLKAVRFAEAKLNDGQRLLAFNDLFIGAASHVSARYRITFNQQTEEHSSSGVIVSTQAGSTGWLSSIFNMANGISMLCKQERELARPELKEEELLFAIREPFKSVRTQVGLTAGLIKGRNNLAIESLMPGGGVIFSDGVEADFLQFNSGAVATIGIAAAGANLVMN